MHERTDSAHSRERQLALRTTGRVLSSCELGLERGDEGAEACGSCIGCEQPDARWGHVKLGWPPNVLVPGRPDPGEAVAGAGRENERANDAANVVGARKHGELRVTAGTMAGCPHTGLRPASADTDC